MRNFINIIFLFVFINCVAQKVWHDDDFVFDGIKTNYTTISNATYGIRNFYILLSADKKVVANLEKLKCVPKHCRAYICQMPEGADKEKFLLEFVTHITDRTKLLDSDLIIISDDDYTKLYKEAEAKSNFQTGYINPIKGFYEFSEIKNICSILK